MRLRAGPGRPLIPPPMRPWALLLSLVLAVAAAAPAQSEPARGPASSCQARRARRPRITAAQRRASQRRHVRATTTETRRWAAMTPPPLVLRPVGAPSPFTLTPIDPSAGTFDDVGLATARDALAHRVDGSTHDIHPRLLQLVYAAVRHFRVPYVHVISGYRSGNPSSRHGQGRAIDLVLPGVTDTRLAAWLRPQGFVGVGIYPTSGFVHLDVRARSYFWRDASGPSERNRERPMLRALGPRYDRAARARGVEPVLDLEASSSEAEVDAEAEVEAGREAAPETLEVEPALVGPEVDAGAPSDAGIDAGAPLR